MNPDLYIVRVQLRALVVGLLVHQMMLHCIASVLLQGLASSLSSLSHVIPQPSSSKSSADGHHPWSLNPRHVEVFLSALDLSYVAALRFDCRPGLKFLLQKVSNLEQPANLYRQASAAWTIKILALLELCLREVEVTGADVDQVKSILLSKFRTRDTMELETYSNLLRYLKELRTTFDELCETYVQVALDEGGRYTKIDNFCEKKLFLLVAQPDDYPEITRKESVEEKLKISNAPPTPPPPPPPPPPPLSSSSVDSKEQDPSRLDVREENVNFEDESDLDDQEEFDRKKEGDDPSRPFRLSDLAVEYSTDSGPESEPVTDDSRPASRMRSVTDEQRGRDSSGGKSSEGFRREKFDVRSLPRDDGDPAEGRRADYEISPTNPFFYQQSHPERRKSDACLLLSGRNSLRFASSMMDSTGISGDSTFYDTDSLRSRSVMELRRLENLDAYPLEQNRKSSGSRDLESPVTAEGSGSGSRSPSILDNVDDLLREYKRSKRGFRTNPFLRDDEDTPAVGQRMYNEEMDLQKTRNIGRDSEAHRKAWAETLNASLDWALALSDDRLSKLLPVLVGGVRVLSRHVVDQTLKQRLSALFHRIALLYGLTSN